MEPTAYHVPDTDLHAEREWREAQLLDRAEKAEAELARLQEEFEKQTTELLVARLWVKELALWLDESRARAEPGLDDGLAFLKLETAKAFEGGVGRAINWRTVLAIAALAMAPWLMVVALGYVAYLVMA